MDTASHDDTTARAQRAIDLITRYGGIDGEHHKTWVIDQVLRLLSGDDYDAIISWMASHDYGWDVGIPP